MDKEIVSVMFAFENCDDFTVYRKDIGEFYLSGIEKSYTRLATNSISEIATAKSFYIEIHKDANFNENRNINYKRELPFERAMRYQDIAQIILEFEDGSNSVYYPVWDEDSDVTNKHQKSIISNVNGHLFIIIDPIETLDSIFEVNINEEDDWNWEMYRD